MPVITQAIDLRDGVFIGGKHLHHTFNPMTNNELTLDQLKEVNGGFFKILKALYDACETSTETIRRAEKGIVPNRIWLTIKEANETCFYNPPGSDIADSDPTAQF